MKWLAITVPPVEVATPECVNLLYDYLLEYYKATKDTFFGVLTHNTTKAILNLPPEDAKRKLDCFCVKISDKYFKEVTKAILKTYSVTEIDNVALLKQKSFSNKIKDELIEWE